MKIYVMDRGVYGMIAVVAENEASARILMECCENYIEDEDIEEHSIEMGLCLYNLGDS